MSAKKRPAYVKIVDTLYEAVVLRVFDRDEKGRPCQAMIVHDDKIDELRNAKNLEDLDLTVIYVRSEVLRGEG